MKQYYGTKPKIGAGPSRAMGKGVIGRMQKKRKKGGPSYSASVRE